MFLFKLYSFHQFSSLPPRNKREVYKEKPRKRKREIQEKKIIDTPKKEVDVDQINYNENYRRRSLRVKGIVRLLFKGSNLALWLK